MDFNKFMEFEGFLDLYLTGCRLKKEEPVQYKYFSDLDKIYIKVKSNPELIQCFIKPREIKDYTFFTHRDKLPPDFLSYSHTFMQDNILNPCTNLILIYYNIDKILKLIDEMEDNHDIYLNKWKLDRIEKVLLLGWNEYCKIHIDYCL